MQDVKARDASCEHISFTTEPTASVQADPQLMEIVVRNLLENARKYGGDQVLVEGFAHGEQYVLVVSDNGPAYIASPASSIGIVSPRALPRPIQSPSSSS